MNSAHAVGWMSGPTRRFSVFLLILSPNSRSTKGVGGGGGGVGGMLVVWCGSF